MQGDEAMDIYWEDPEEILCEECFASRTATHAYCLKYHTVCASAVDELRDDLRSLLLDCDMYDNWFNPIYDRWYNLAANIN